MTMLINLLQPTVSNLQGVSFFGFDPFTRDFITRVEADGGTVESAGCIRKRLYPTFQYSITTSYWLPFRDRVETDGGTAESGACLSEKLEDINITT